MINTVCKQIKDSTAQINKGKTLNHTTCNVQFCILHFL